MMYLRVAFFRIIIIETYKNSRNGTRKWIARRSNHGKGKIRLPYHPTTIEFQYL